MGGMGKKTVVKKVKSVCNSRTVSASGNEFPSGNETLHWGGQAQKDPGPWKGRGGQQKTRRIHSLWCHNEQIEH